jgi:hypothetical protein
VVLLSTALTNQEGELQNNNSGKHSEASMVRNFANQFNVNIKIDNLDK